MQTGIIQKKERKEIMELTQLLEDKFENGIDQIKYLEYLDENKELHHLHYKRFQADPALVELFKSVSILNILVITEPWCYDSIAMIPIVQKLAELSGNTQLRIVMRDQNPDLMQNFLTNGKQAIPVFIFMDGQFRVLFRFGPRPKPAKTIFEKFKPDIDAGIIDKQDVLKKIRNFYSRDKGKETQKELAELFRSI